MNVHLPTRGQVFNFTARNSGALCIDCRLWLRHSEAMSVNYEFSVLRSIKNVKKKLAIRSWNCRFNCVCCMYRWICKFNIVAHIAVETLINQSQWLLEGVMQSSIYQKQTVRCREGEINHFMNKIKLLKGA